jgi:hypothetical protein
LGGYIADIDPSRLQIDVGRIYDTGDLRLIAAATRSCCRSAPGLGPEIAIPPDHTGRGGGHGSPPITDTEVALVAAPEASAASRRLAEPLANFCPTLDPRMPA